MPRILSRPIASALLAYGLWRAFGPEVPPRFRGPQRRPPLPPGRSVLAGRHEFFVREMGPADGPPLVLFHGWVYDGLATWHRLAPYLAETHRLYMVDLRGHGRSARIRGRVGVDDLADETAAVMDSLGLGAVDLMGYSLGGMVAQALVRRYPGRVNRLVLAATAARPVWWPRWVTVPVFLLGRAAARFDRLVAPRIAYRYLTRTGAIPAQYGAWLWESLLDRDVDLYYQAGFAILRFDGSDGLRRIDVPTLSIVPTEDQLIPPSRQRETALALQDNRIVEVQGARHEMVMTHPEEVAKAVRGFLS